MAEQRDAGPVLAAEKLSDWGHVRLWRSVRELLAMRDGHEKAAAFMHAGAGESTPFGDLVRKAAQSVGLQRLRLQAYSNEDATKIADAVDAAIAKERRRAPCESEDAQ